MIDWCPPYSPQFVVQKMGGTSGFFSYLVGSEVADYEEDRFVIKVTTANAQAWLDKRLRPVVAWTMEAVVGRPVEIEFTV